MAISVQTGPGPGAGAGRLVEPAGGAGIAGVPRCERCGAPIVERRRSARRNASLCLSCDQRARRSAYFRSYYLAHKERILDKNRRWARNNREKLVQLRLARLARQSKPGETRRCIECGAPVVRATRCRRCYIRYRYATDPAYRARRLATTRRWLERRQARARSTQQAAQVQALQAT